MVPNPSFLEQVAAAQRCEAERKAAAWRLSRSLPASNQAQRVVRGLWERVVTLISLPRRVVAEIRYRQFVHARIRYYTAQQGN